MQFAILGKDVNGNIPYGEGCQWKHTFWPSKKKKKRRSWVYAIALRSCRTTMAVMRSNIGIIATMKTAIYAA